MTYKNRNETKRNKTNQMPLDKKNMTPRAHDHIHDKKREEGHGQDRTVQDSSVQYRGGLYPAAAFQSKYQATTSAQHEPLHTTIL